jgi:predicted RNase H-like HicB family nuclease
MTERRVVYRRTGDGSWSGSVIGVPRCRGRGRTLRVARRRLRAALADALGEEARGLTFVEDVRLSGGARRLVVAHWKARKLVEARQRRAEEASRQAAAALRAAGLAPRDICDLLGLSPARVAALKRKA